MSERSLFRDIQHGLKSRVTLAAVVFSLITLAQPLSAQVLAFPGAEGFGARATGGRGCDVYEVTNLNDSGPGSLRDAVSQPNRTIVFRVSGTIELNSRLTINQPNLTIAGQTAPGDGICLRRHELFISNTNNIIVRYLRIRPGDEAKAEHDALTIWNARDVIIDQCSLSWSTDSLNDVVKGSGDVTVQWCILSEPLNASVHVKGAHGYGTGWDGRWGGASYHHNLIAHCDSRAPRIGYYNQGRGLIDVRNNVVYNWGKMSGYGCEGDDANYVGNYYRPGPSTQIKPMFFEIWKNDARMFVQGNFFEGLDEINRDNTKGVKLKEGLEPAECLVKAPFPVRSVETDSAEDAFKKVLERAGAVLPRRDAVDQRIIEDVKNRTGRIIDSPASVGGWPELKSSPAPVDSDHDGMPDEWEVKNNLNPNDPSDGPRITETGYTNLENYLNTIP